MVNQNTLRMCGVKLVFLERERENNAGLDAKKFNDNIKLLVYFIRA